MEPLAPVPQDVPAFVASDVPTELPYPLAKRMRDQGRADAEIVAELKRTGLSESDAQFVMNSLPGGHLSQSQMPLDANVNTGASGLPITGLAMLGLGVVVTVGSYSAAAPGGTYVVTWGLILAGIMRIMRGR